MKSSEKMYYESLDQPEVLRGLFHPRPEYGYRPLSETRTDFFVPVEDQIQIGASLHLISNTAPVLLFFHGNGEIVQDYDDLGILFNQQGLNFCVVDYRGYGASTGTPTVAAMMADCHVVLDFMIKYLAENGISGDICVMGRSLGSAAAIELAANRKEDMMCLIIESGFAMVSPLLKTIGVQAELTGLKKNQGFENIDKIKKFPKPCLIIHAKHDHIIPFSNGQDLYESCPAKNKTLLEVKGANHNDIFSRGVDEYLFHLKKICTQKV